jgi:hypothetical protein
MASTDAQPRRFYTSHGRERSGVVMAWLHMQPASFEGADSETIATRCFMRYEAETWTDDEAAEQVRAWAEAELIERGYTEGLS